MEAKASQIATKEEGGGPPKDFAAVALETAEQGDESESGEVCEAGGGVSVAT